ncbi:biotin carboxylase N-terminal domain-containing protein [Humibacter sp. RRB41]|uniref:acetyl/propionyl/methylcrotonyl-CoA carboxylase subunit alpha n=1 Tax=Humibacter sp. RRB41 TaxID=2919946 RepID=UPI001FA9F2DB|nr:biotin carboxylase N-terminal domain-containing protein [Humibacter sp. RRB41]
MTARPPFDTVLVANRGEIARRVIRTLRGMGIRSIAVYSDADANAPHVREADVACRIGPAAAARSYLDIDAVLDAARSTGAQAVHPGYGFLSENADFARACEAAGIVFIGPPASAIETMGDKVSAKRLVAQSGVPVTPGVDDRTLDDESLARAAERLGLPVLVKPSAGGGGMGMVEVHEAVELPAALRTARRVALAAFGDDALFVERLVTAPRHIEVQVLADEHGAVVHLGERECSLQRRHQKVIEEAPSPLVDAALRARLGAAACEAARSVGYVGVGTVEFLVSDDDPDSFFFMEMNTRLQVEHPVTELVATVRGARGLDLVEQQVRVAAGETLAFAQDDVTLTGHAIEARVYAEDVPRGFLPATGSVLALHEPQGDGIRVDSALVEGLEITDAYDPMLAKVIAWAHDREEALTRLSAGLRDTAVLGVSTNVAFLAALVDDADVRAGRLDTGLIARFIDRGAASSEVPDTAFATAALLVHDDAWRAGTDAPWSRPTGWRMSAPAPARYRIATDAGSDAVEVSVVGAPEHSSVRVGDGSPITARVLDRSDDRMLVELDGATHAFRAARARNGVWLFSAGETWALRMLPLARSAGDRGAAARASDAASSPNLVAPMPGTVVAVEASDGEVVEPGAGVLVIEAMKMEHRLTAPHRGILHLNLAPGDKVGTDQVVATVEPLDDERLPDPTTDGTTSADNGRTNLTEAIPTTEGSR